jgi:hypothetical protein
MVYSGARRTLIHEKKPEFEISCQTPFNHSWNVFKFQQFPSLLNLSSQVKVENSRQPLFVLCLYPVSKVLSHL